MPPKSTIMESLLRRLHLLPTPVMDTFGAIIFERALMAGLKMGVFEAIARGPLSVEEISAQAHLHPEAVRLLADAYVAGGYLKRIRGKYSAGAETRKWLLRSSPSYIGNLMLYFETLHKRLGGLEYSIAHGRPLRPYYESFSDEDWEIYARGMADLARLLLADVFRTISAPEPGSRLLDIGGSHGLYALEFCRRISGSTAVVMDFEGALRYAEALVREAGFGDRIRLVPGNYLSKSLPDGMDVVFMFNVIHGFDDDTNRELIRRTSGTLHPGGKLYILDQTRNGTGALSDFIPLMVGLNLLNEIGGRVYTADEVRDWCKGARRFKVMRLKFPGVTILEASDWRTPPSSA